MAYSDLVRVIPQKVSMCINRVTLHHTTITNGQLQTTALTQEQTPPCSMGTRYSCAAIGDIHSLIISTLALPYGRNQKMAAWKLWKAPLADSEELHGLLLKTAPPQRVRLRF